MLRRWSSGFWAPKSAFSCISAPIFRDPAIRVRSGRPSTGKAAPGAPSNAWRAGRPERSAKPSAGRRRPPRRHGVDARERLGNGKCAAVEDVKFIEKSDDSKTQAVRLSEPSCKIKMLLTNSEIG